MSAQTEKPIRTIRIKAGTMYCESCNTSTIAKWTMTRIYKGGKEVERQQCDECNNEQETEFFSGPTTQIRNKK
jgi:hypothetical protein